MAIFCGSRKPGSGEMGRDTGLCASQRGFQLLVARLIDAVEIVGHSTGASMVAICFTRVKYSHRYAASRPSS